MANKSKLKKRAKSKKPAIKKAVLKEPAKKKLNPKKALLKKEVPPRKVPVAAKVGARKVSEKKSTDARKKRMRGKSEVIDTVTFRPAGVGGGGGQSGDLQGLSDIADVDSESVDELVEEGNAFEAEVVEGVEDGGDADQGEVRSHESPEDDVPEEYEDQ